MTAQQRPAYPLGATTIERDRLVSQAARYEPHASWLLDRIGIRPGWRALDIGCGPIGILDLLSERVGPSGHVVGLEREPRFAAMARDEIAARALVNAEIIEADAFHHRLEEGTFDLVHERLLMINVTAREELVTRMMALLRPGGTVILEDVDNVSWLCEPAHPSWTALREAFFAAYAANGGDVFIGRRLPHYLRTTGAQGIEVKVHVGAAPAGDYRRKHLLWIVDSIADKILEMKIFTPAELQRHREALEAHLEDPATLVIDKLLVQAWGHKQT